MLVGRSNTRGELGAAAALYALLALAASWPLARFAADHVPGLETWHGRTLHAEGLLNLWNLWWFRHATVELGQSPFTCPLVLYPYGVDLWFHTLAPLHGLAGLLLQSLLPLPATQNLLLLVDFVAAGACAFALARRLGLPRSGSLLAGGIFAFSPAVFAHLAAGHYELIATFWLPALLLVFLRLLEAPRWPDALLLGALFTGALYSSQYYFVYGLELLAVAALVCWRRVLARDRLRALALAAGVALLGISPMLLAYLSGSAPASEDWAAALPDFDFHAGDLLGILSPSFLHPLLAGPLASLHDRLNPGRTLPQETTLFAGLSALALAALACARRSRPDPALRLALVIALVFWLLSLGAHLDVLGEKTALPLPALLLAQLPGVQAARAPGRHIVVAMLGLGLLAGMGFGRLGSRPLRASLLAALAFEYAAIPFPLMGTQVAQAYQQVAREPEGFAILDVPPGVRDGRRGAGRPSNRHILGQTVHRRPIVDAAVSRLPPKKWSEILSAPVIGDLLAPRRLTAASVQRSASAGPAFFARARIDVLVVHPQASQGQRRYLEHVLRFARRERFEDGSELWWLAPPPESLPSAPAPSGVR